MTKWIIKTTEDFDKTYKKLDKSIQKQIGRWIYNHLTNVKDPRSFGKPLVGELSGYWRYRIGDYRLLVEINNNELIILMIDIGHRKDVYVYFSNDLKN